MSVDFARVMNPDFDDPISFGMTEKAAIDAIVAAQKASGDPIDPAGAKRLLRSLTAIGLFKPA